MKLRSTARTDVGRVREHNEDTFGLGEGESVERLGELLVVCDGMGGHASGEVASQLAVATILEVYYAVDDDDRPAALKRAFVTANARVYTQGRGTMGTTGVAAVLHHDALHVANVGDSRGYLIRDGSIRQITRDHSFVGDQIAAGVLTPEQARISSHRNIITRALGHQSDVTVDLFRWPLQVGDTVVLCSDGLHGLIEDAELLQLVQETPLEHVADTLVDLANTRGGSDNITVVVAQVEGLDWNASLLDVAAPGSATTAQITEQIVPPPAADPSAPADAPTAPLVPPAERPLSLLGGLLSALLLATLLLAILFVSMNPAPALAPTVTPAAATAAPVTTPSSATTTPAAATAAPTIAAPTPR
ncbi:MAG: Stp1/IreP family PP2C-type Ser/Thr phosphatase [Roseiflexaceae bacterium]|nr:Stp1/IreP family PP2C-type Ser/Thr phosphatase [Roseiflexaceae bacterium]